MNKWLAILAIVAIGLFCEWFFVMVVRHFVGG